MFTKLKYIIRNSSNIEVVWDRQMQSVASELCIRIMFSILINKQIRILKSRDIFRLEEQKLPYKLYPECIKIVIQHTSNIVP